jgi:hypothetical protein
LYVLVIMVATMVVSPILSIVASVRIAEGRAEQTRREQAAVDLQVKAEGLRFFCDQFGRVADAFDPSKSPVGRDVLDVYVFLYNLINCVPPKK